jgi:hypothetical protein
LFTCTKAALRPTVSYTKSSSSINTMASMITAFLLHVIRRSRHGSKCNTKQYRGMFEGPDCYLRCRLNYGLPCEANKQLHTDLGISPVREEITNVSHKYKDKLTAHPNELATTLLNDEVEPRRLKRFKPADLMKQHI